jgi:predicted amidohydrolase YtcJ
VFIFSLFNSASPPLDIHSAIDAYTINAAKALGLDKVTGSITLGKFADLAILEGDITKMTPEEIANTGILMTLLEGQVVFDIDLGEEDK